MFKKKKAIFAGSKKTYKVKREVTSWEKITYKVNNTERGAYCAISNSTVIRAKAQGWFAEEKYKGIYKYRGSSSILLIIKETK